MRSYAQVAPTFWTRGSGKKLRGNKAAQLLALYLMTAPSSNFIGIYYLPLVTICHETGLTEQEILEAFPVISEIAKYDSEAELVWLREAACYQIGETLAPKDKRRGAIERELSAFSSHPFAEEFYARYGEAYRLERTEQPRPSSGAQPPDPLGPSKGHSARQDAPSKGHPPDEKPPFPVPAPVPAPVTPKPSPKEPTTTGTSKPVVAPSGGGGVDFTDSDRITPIPPDLHERAEQLGVIAELARKLGEDPAALRAEAESYVTHFVVTEPGERRNRWMQSLRRHLVSRSKAKALPAVTPRSEPAKPPKPATWKLEPLPPADPNPPPPLPPLPVRPLRRAVEPVSDPEEATDVV